MIADFFIWLDWDVPSIIGMAGLIVAGLGILYLVIFQGVRLHLGFPVYIVKDEEDDR